MIGFRYMQFRLCRLWPMLVFLLACGGRLLKLWWR
jgi:hypothetical protein